jgi:acetylornithine deacetylase
MWLDAPSGVAQDLLSAVSQETPATVSYATDAGWFQTLGHRCVIFGPGSIEVAHKPNEHLPIGQFEQARSILDTLIEHRVLTTSTTDHPR